MVSPQNPSNQGDIASMPATAGRGFVTREEAVTAAPLQQQVPPARSLVGWGAVIAGSLLTISLLILSGSLAYACGVPAYVLPNGAYGWGAGIWSVITAAIAFFCGASLSAYLTPASSRTSALLHGVAVWALSLPLVYVLFNPIGGMFGRAGQIGFDVVRMTINGAPLMAQPTHASWTGASWGAFLSIAVGLIFAAIGGVSGFMSPRFRSQP